MRSVKSFTSVVKFTGRAARSVAIIMIWAITIHIRRRPQRSEDRTSTNGPIAHLNAQGR